MLASLIAAGSGCGGATLLHGPIADRCTSAGLKGCDEIADGVVDVVDGKKEDGLRKVSRGAGKNAPDDVRAFAGSLKEVAMMPGLGSYAATLNQVADALRDDAGEESSGAAASLKAKTVDAPLAAYPPKDAAIDDSKLRIGTAHPGRLGEDCDTASLGTSSCQRVLLGPADITSVIVAGGCGAPLEIFAGDPANPHWDVVVPANGTLTLTGIEIPLAESERLEIATPTAAPTGTQCAVTWVARRR